MEWSTLELKVMSCRHLTAFNFFHKLSVYAAVSIIDGESKKKEQQQRQKTPADRDGGTKPEWNHLMQFDLKALDGDCSHFLISFDLHCEGIFYGRKTVGKVRVSLKDLIDEFNGAVRFVSYQVRSSDGKPNGVINFSYKLKGTTKEGTTASPEIELSTGFQSSTDRKLHYPSLEVSDQSRDNLYPSLDDIRSPLPGIYSPLPSLKYDHKTDVYGMTNPPPLSPQMPPFVQTPGRWYVVESTGYGWHGCPNVGQLGTFDVQRGRV